MRAPMGITSLFDKIDFQIKVLFCIMCLSFEVQYVSDRGMLCLFLIQFLNITMLQILTVLSNFG